MPGGMHRSPNDPAVTGARIGLKWKPPPRRRGVGFIDEQTEQIVALLGELDDRPGEWAELASFDVRTRASQIRARMMKRDDVAKYEIVANTSRKGDVDSSSIYARRRP